jgi:hypothetical protein
MFDFNSYHYYLSIAVGVINTEYIIGLIELFIVSKETR